MNTDNAPLGIIIAVSLFLGGIAGQLLMGVTSNVLHEWFKNWNERRIIINRHKTLAQLKTEYEDMQRYIDNPFILLARAAIKVIVYFVCLFCFTIIYMTFDAYRDLVVYIYGNTLEWIRYILIAKVLSVLTASWPILRLLQVTALLYSYVRHEDYMKALSTRIADLEAINQKNTT